MGKDTVKDHFVDVVEELEGCQNILQKREKLLEAGFEFFDDEENSEDPSDILEEQAARPETERQRKLVAFFEGKDDPSAEILDCFLAEKHSDDINYPLVRRYFRQGNSQLKKIIVRVLTYR